MAYPKISESALMAALVDTFRTFGYEGTSLSRLSKVTGLEKASLYHRFPGGKEEMVAAVLRYVAEWFAANVIEPLQAEGSSEERVRRAAAKLREFYEEGRKPCVLDTLSFPLADQAAPEGIYLAGSALLQAFTKAARDSGASAPVARRRAEQAIIEIEGALVFARALRDPKPFQRVMERLPGLIAARPLEHAPPIPA